VTGGWNMLRNDELHDLCSSPDVEDEIGTACSMYESAEDYI
jgi:hypothetical protein